MLTEWFLLLIKYEEQKVSFFFDGQVAVRIIIRFVVEHRFIRWKLKFQIREEKNEREFLSF